MSDTASSPAWRQPSCSNDPAAGPRGRNDSRGGWAERTWGRATSWVESLERSVLARLPWKNFSAVFGEATFKAMVESRDATKTLVERFAEDDSITAEQVIETIDKCVQVWSSAVREAKAEGRFRGKTVRELAWCS